MKTSRLLTLVFSLMAVAIHAQEMADFKWLAGSWIGDGFGGVSEEIWSPAQGGTMMGTYRHLDKGKINFYEFMLIVEENDTIKLKIKHFNPDMSSWEEKSESQDFPLIEASQDRIKFDGLEYVKIGDNEMRIILQLEEEGEVTTEVFNYRRQRINE